jgi:hypothetical protein
MRFASWGLCVLLVCCVVAVLSACSRPPREDAALAATGQARARGASATPTFDGVRGKDFVQCGVTTGVAGFSTPDAQGEWRGLDVDVCRAIAAAVLGDAKRVRFTPLTAAQRFTALQTGEVDVLSRITTITFQRDHLWAVRIGQVHAHPLRQPAGSPSERPDRRRRHRADERTQEDRRGPARRGHGLSAVQSLSASHHPGELHAGSDLGEEAVEAGGE